ncbi:MAG TPA: adenylate/guanylate cyclase domain-containing protein [Anaeromyxobacteraceae bacterium]|nr:adenylate/guanylate cyclase domain-containing protein [Anaeromyxobacteraceae bacterium]
MRSENLAVMLTDMQGFTAATARQTRDENARMVALHDALLAPVLRVFHGHRVKSIGDAYLVLFSSSTRALLCGMAIQDRLWDYNRRVEPDRRIEVRIAVTLGEVTLVRSGGTLDVYGEAVNLSARIEREATAGEIWLSEAAWLTADRDELAIEEIGSRTLRGIAEPVRIFRVSPATSGAPGVPVDAVAEPPYGNAALTRVRGLKPADPAALSEVSTPEAGLDQLAVRLGRIRDSFFVRAAVVLGALAAAAWTGLWFFSRSPERLIARERFEEAAVQIDAEARALPPGDPRILWLRGMLEIARADAGRPVNLVRGFDDLARAAASDHSGALGLLAEQGRAATCERRTFAARALAVAETKAGIPALKIISAKDPPAPEPPTALGRLKRSLGADGYCHAGDVARRALERLEGRR